MQESVIRIVYTLCPFCSLWPHTCRLPGNSRIRMKDIQPLDFSGRRGQKTIVTNIGLTSHTVLIIQWSHYLLLTILVCPWRTWRERGGQRRTITTNNIQPKVQSTNQHRVCQGKLDQTWSPFLHNMQKETLLWKGYRLQILWVSFVTNTHCFRVNALRGNFLLMHCEGLQNEGKCHGQTC